MRKPDLAGHVEHQQHLVGAVAVVLHQDAPGAAPRPGSRASGRAAAAARPWPGPSCARRPTCAGSPRPARRRRAPGRRCPCGSRGRSSCRRRAWGSRRRPSSARRARPGKRIAAAERPGRFLTVKPRPPIRLAEPGQHQQRGHAAGQPRAAGPGSCGQKPCSALTSAVIGRGGLVAVGVRVAPRGWRRPPGASGRR